MSSRSQVRLAVAVLFVACIVAGARGETEAARKRRESCIAETGVKSQTVESIRMKDQIIPEDPKIHCYFACYMKKMGVMTPEGAYDPVVATQKMLAVKVDPDHVTEIVSKCKDLRADDACLTASLLADCFFKTKKFDFSVLENLED